ncbi:MAG TPA: hypothetical protein VGF60_12940 [Xanthobacteraceae bacterium]|jgi:hypothetical protein
MVRRLHSGSTIALAALALLTATAAQAWPQRAVKDLGIAVSE